MNYKALEEVLKAEYGEQIIITKVSPLHDEDFEATYMVCIEDCMICRADNPLSSICKSLESNLEIMRANR